MCGMMCVWGEIGGVGVGIVVVVGDEEGAVARVV